MPHATLPSPGLQAFILCGPGSSLATFTSNPRDLPKALLPVANRPMVWYALDWCHRMGVSDITLITPPDALPALEAALATNPALTTLPSPKAEVLAPEDLTLTTGTAELLRLPQVQKAINGDFILLPCDLISELEGTKLLQQWLTLNPFCNAASYGKKKSGLAVFYPTYGVEGLSTKHDETDFLATIPVISSPSRPPAGSLRKDIEQIVLNMPTDTLNDKLESDKGTFRLRTSLLSSHARVKLRMKYRDAGIYFFPSWIKDFSAENEAFESVSEDVLSWWARSGWQDATLARKLALDTILSSTETTTNGDEAEAEDSVDLASMSSTQTKVNGVPETEESVFASRVRTSGSTGQKKKVAIPPLLAYIQPTHSAQPSQPLIRRADTTPQLLSLSLRLAKLFPFTHPLAHETKIHSTAAVDPQARISNEDCLVGENVRIASRAVLKECVVGANCVIGPNVRLTKCLLMEGVVIGEGVTASGTVMGRRARLEGVAREPGKTDAGKAKGKQKEEDDKTKLTDCEVAPGFMVEAGTQSKNEKFMGFDTDDLEVDDGEDGNEE